MTKKDLIAICNGQWIGSEVSGIVLESVKHDKLFIFHKTISFFMKLLELEHSVAYSKTKRREHVFLTPYFYQRWLSFLQKSHGKNFTSKSNKKATEHPCNEIMVGWPYLHHVQLQQSCIEAAGTTSKDIMHISSHKRG